MRFLANFKYTIKDEIVKAQSKPEMLMQTYQALKTADYGKFDSRCDQTMVGFVQQIPSITKSNNSLTTHPISCFYAKQQTHYDMEKTVSVKTESDTVKVAVITSQNKIVT